MSKKILMFGTFGNLKGLPGGGGQTSARRLWKSLEGMGAEVIIVNRHRNSSNNRILSNIKTINGMFLDSIIWIYKLLVSPRKTTSALVIGYGGIMSIFDDFIVTIAFLLRFKVFYYLKGGGTELMYRNNSKIFKNAFYHCVNRANTVMVEGMANLTFINQIKKENANVHYIPNFIEKSFMPNCYPAKSSKEVNIIYFGRIDESKNVKLIVAIFDVIAGRYPEVSLTIVGKKGSKYSNEVDKMILSSPYRSRITRIGHSSHDELSIILKEQHIFIFPSKEVREGHSNSLNEAMAWGVVPIVSSNNFLPLIVGDRDLVVEGFEVNGYANAISNLIDNNIIENKSRMVYQRVIENFTQVVVERELKNVLLID